jgi:hypothetical protein
LLMQHPGHTWNGLLNHCSKLACEENTLGSRKLSSDHISNRLFCNGVPVSKMRWFASYACPREDTPPAETEPRREGGSECNQCR